MDVTSHIQNRRTAAILVYSTKFYVVKAFVQVHVHVHVHVHVPLYEAREAIQCICQVSCKRRQMDNRRSAKPPLARQKRSRSHSQNLTVDSSGLQESAPLFNSRSAAPLSSRL